MFDVNTGLLVSCVLLKCMRGPYHGVGGEEQEGVTGVEGTRRERQIFDEIYGGRQQPRVKILEEKVEVIGDVIVLMVLYY